MGTFKNFKFGLRQEGNFLIAEEKTLSSYTDRTSIMVYFPTETTMENIMLTTGGNPYEAILDIDREYTVDFFAVSNFPDVDTSGGISITWNNGKVWICTSGSCAGTPGEDINWAELDPDSSNTIISILNDEYIARYYFTMIDANFNADITVVKKADHFFDVRWDNATPVKLVVLKDYNGRYLKDLEYNEHNLQVELEEDGIYYVEITYENDVIEIAEIYDMTDIEKCYLNIIKNVYCSCTDCNGCVGKELNNMINFVNTYIILRDMIYSDRRVNVGLIAQDTLRTDYTTVIGRLIDKLKALVSECYCNK